MSTIVNKATPRAILNGVQDLSGREPLPESPQIPQHLPLLYLFTAKGPDLPQLVSGDAAATMYGRETFLPQGKFTTHQTILANRIMGTGQQVFIQRLTSPDAKKAMLRYSAEVIATTIEIYERNADGSIKYEIDLTGAAVPVVEDTVVGSRVVWHVGVTPYVTTEQKEFGRATVLDTYRNGDVVIAGGTKKLGEIIDGATTIVTKSTLYPIMDLEFNSVGGEGNLHGLEFIAPTTKLQIPAPTSTIEGQRAYVYRLAVKRRSSANTTPTPIRTAGDDVYLEVTLKENTESPFTGKPISMRETFVKAYQKRSAATAPAVDGPFSRVHVYQQQLDLMLDRLVNGGTDSDGNTFLGEKDFDDQALAFQRRLPFEDPLNKHLFNPFTGRDYRDVPYFSVDVNNSIKFGGVSFGTGAHQYATGGDDGLPMDVNGRPDLLARLQVADELTRDHLDNFGNGEATLLDAAFYPMSAVWDSGFSHRTKPSLFVPIGRRKDILAHLSTQAIADYVAGINGEEWQWIEPNNHETEISHATNLRTQAILYPESTLFGTQAFRAVIIGHCGQDIREEWNGNLPLIVDFAEKVARYMGAADGLWKERWAFDQDGNNQVTAFRDVNLTYKSPENYDRSWDAGLNWVQYGDRTRLFYPAIQTVYDDDTSVLNSYFVAAGACTLERICQQSWMRITGNQKLTKEQIIDRSNKFILEAAEGAFDGRFDISVRTFHTEADKQRGYSWSCEVTLRTDPMETVGSFTIIAQRRDEEGNLTAA